MRIDTSLSIYQKALLKELGPDYRKQLFDLEQVIYRDLGTYDIEISGGHRKKDPFAIYVWLKEWPKIVERHLRLPHDHRVSDGDGAEERHRARIPVNGAGVHQGRPPPLPGGKQHGDHLLPGLHAAPDV